MRWLLLSWAGFGCAPEGEEPTAQGNGEPHAALQLDGKPQAGVDVIIDAADSWDPDGDAITFHWTFDHKPEGSGLDESQITGNDSRSAEGSFVPDELGVYVVAVVPEDARGLRGQPSYLTVDVAEDAAPAVAHAGSDREGFVGDVFVLDGSLNGDPLGRAIQLSWHFTNLPGGSAATLADATGMAPSFEADVPGLYSVSLEVTNGVTTSAPDVVDVLVSNPTNTPPVSVVSNDGIVVEDCLDAVLDGSTSHDPDGDALSYHWAIQSRPEGSILLGTDIDGRDEAVATFRPDVAGVYVLSLGVFDGSEWVISTGTVEAIERTHNAAPDVYAGANFSVDAGLATCSMSGGVWNCGECDEVVIELGTDAEIVDPDGAEVMSVAWEVVVGEATLGAAGLQKTTASIRDLEPSSPECETFEVIFELAATDCPGTVAHDTVQTTVICCGVPE